MRGKFAIPASDYSAFIVPSKHALISTPDKFTTRPTSTVVKPEGSDEMAPWGDGNDFPQLVIKDVNQDPELPNLLDLKARLLVSGGLEHGILGTDENGDEILNPVPPAIDKEIKEWKRKSNINRYLYESALDLCWFGNSFPEIVLSQDRKKIVQLVAQAAEQCRWSKQNPKTGVIDFCFINANFPGPKADDVLTKRVPVLDPYYDPASNLLIGKGLNYIYPLSIPSPGSTYYQLANWNSIRASGWLDVSRAIPKFKKSVLEKQMTIKYHIEISDKFWGFKYDGFDSKTPEQKAVIKETEVNNFQDILAGLESAGSNIFTPMITDPSTGKEFPLWKITPLDDKLKTGTFLEEGKDASLYKYASIGVHPAILGTMPNNGLGGAGSNIREAYLLQVINGRPIQDIILEPLNTTVNFYNGWEEVTFRIKNQMMTTLDTGKETQKVK